jgi:hypothetical protein
LRRVAVAAVVSTLVSLVGAGAASAEECKSPSGAACAPYWKLLSRTAPTNLPLAGEELKGEHDKGVKGEGVVIATAQNLGDANVNATTEHVTVTDQLPAGLKPVKIEALSGRGVPGGGGIEQKLKCSETEEPVHHTFTIECTFEGELPPFEQLEVRIYVEVTTTTSAEPSNVVSVTGGATPPEKLERPVKIAGGSTRFGVETYELTPENENGSVDNQAGTHPFQLTTTFNLNQGYGEYEVVHGSRKRLPQAPALQKDLNFRIPAGLLGNATAAPQCTGVDFGASLGPSVNGCQDGTAIGVALVSFNDPIEPIGWRTWSVPVFNLVPAAGEPARLGFAVEHAAVVLDTSVRTGEDYGATVSVRKTTESVQVLGAQVTLWGVPGDPSHDRSRGWNCLGAGHYALKGGECKLNEFPHPSPFLVLPTSCAAPLATSVTGDAWPDAEGNVQTLSASNEPPYAKSSQPIALDPASCKTLPFDPSISVIPDQSSGSTPSGMTVEVTMPQQNTTLALPPALAEGDIKETTLALPPGVAASAGAANGLQVCGGGESGLLGQPFEANFEQQFTSAAATCPDAAKIGDVVVNTPFLPNPLLGGVYLGFQHTNPFLPPLELLIVATEEEPIHHEGSKVLIKLAGEVKICQEVKDACKEVGQLISTFRHTPQAPFEHLKVHLFDGPRASQATPARCGLYESTMTAVPWSEGVAPKTPSSSFEVGQPCAGSGPLPFSPAFSAGATNTQAGAFTPFTLHIGHPDGNQGLDGLSMRLPQGAAAMLSSVTPCSAAKADVGGCGPESLIGHAVTSSGLGGSPVTLGGEVFLTESLRPGTPFGVSVLTNAEHVGPFNIGKIIANSTIQVDPNTAAATITAVETRILESSGGLTIAPTPLPTVIKGVPVQLKEVTVNVDRPNFQFNPTNCSGHSVTRDPMAISDTLNGAEGGISSQLTPYGVTGCASLKFEPKLTASVVGQATKENGTTFSVTVESKFGQANIAKTFLALPIALPSRLTTIQKACLVATFDLPPVGHACGEGSHIGDAIAHTPVLKQPLTGPAYLVSHGSASFPDVEFVLQGEGIKVVLDGKTDIKNGITYSRFETIPDAPVEKFETTFPAGPHSALTANVPESEHFNLCKHAAELVIPTEITGQNGAVIKQNTQVALTGCGGVAGSCRGSKARSHSCLVLALAECRKKYKGKAKRKKRASCEALAHKKYGPKPSHKHKKH